MITGGLKRTAPLTHAKGVAFGQQYHLVPDYINSPFLLKTSNIIWRVRV